ncbi:hypothetical protein GGS26DRAFT_572533 [Hypomontagnella submonticulosa]|nr:hypothetical protein GGS26DRAFT_572533 [Hypomontagnella submonticulosa]
MEFSNNRAEPSLDLKRQDGSDDSQSTDDDDQSIDDEIESTGSSPVRVGNRGGLFVSSTISKDDTFGQASNQQSLLSQLNSQLASRALELNSFGLPPLATARERPPQSSGRGPLPPPSRTFPHTGPIPTAGPMVGGHPGILPGGGFIPGRPPPPPFMYRPPAYPISKVSENAQWRHKLMKDRGLLTDTDWEDTDYDTSQSEKKPRIKIGKDSNGKKVPSLVRDKSSTTKISSTSSVRPSPPPRGNSNLRTIANTKQHSGGYGNNQTTEQPGLAESLSAIAEKHLKVDVLDQTRDVSRFMSYLLDTIQMLENQVRYSQARDNENTHKPHPSPPNTDEHSTTLRGRVLHRVCCGNGNHHHHGALYEDEPVFGSSPVDRGLVGEIPIGNLDVYLAHHPEILFVVIREYTCVKEIPSRAAQRDSRQRGFFKSQRGERMQIASPLLQRALAQVAEFDIYPQAEYVMNGHTQEMDAPYPFLFHHRKQLAELAEQDAYKEAIKPLLDFLNEKYGSEYEEAENLLKGGQVTAYHVSKMFKPNQMVINRRSPNILEAYVLKTYAVFEGEKVKVWGWSWSYNGTELYRRPWQGIISGVTDEPIQISELAVHPIEFARGDDIRDLEARGEKFWDMKGQVYTCYTGWDTNHQRHYTNARFMVDVATYQLMHRLTAKVVGEDEISKFDVWPSKINRQDELPPKMALLLPATTFGFDLHSKRWVNLYVENFRKIDWNKKAFDRLVLEDKLKEMIYALVNVQTSAKKMDDIVTGKGNGLIILLHGSPGTGKTLTAESVAEIAEKPLYRVTCGDIGTDAPKVEKYLETVLYLGKIWDCVLLLDEADVFLEERTIADLERNSLVSVFLRILEYYEGILILTSNRVGTFDEAFKSRIQVAIHYNKLKTKSRKAIWRNFLDMIEDSADEDANISELEGKLDELAAEDMNGRQIRNALLTARQLAKHKNETLNWSHLSQVMRTSAEFNKYLKDVKGHTDDQWARAENLR